MKITNNNNSWETHTGAFLGLARGLFTGTVSIQQCFWNREFTGLTEGVGRVEGDENNFIYENNFSLSTAEMKIASIFINNGWDFDDVWTIEAGVNEGYPFLRSSPPVSNFEPDDPVVLDRSRLVGNFPNPFNPSTTIRFEVRGSRFVKIEVYNIRGQRVRTLLDGSRAFETGVHSVVWNGRDDNGRMVGSGVYLYKMTSDGFSEVKRMMLLK